MIRHGLLGALFLLPTTLFAQIRVNQVGMYPNQEKTAVIEGVVSAGKVKITDARTGKSVAKAKVLRTATSPWSKKKRTVIDFSGLKQPGKYLITCGKEKKNIWIDMQDNGKGMSRKNARRVFMPGFTTKTRGWGVGMTLCQRIIQSYHHGKIEVRKTEPGKGTTFRITLPEA